GLDFSLALGLFLVAMALLFRLAADFGSVALDLLGRLAGGAALGFLFGLAALFDVAQPRIRKGAGARGALGLGQGRQHHAGAGVTLLLAGGRTRGTAHRRLRGGCRGLCNHGFRRMRLRAVAADAALATLLDHDLLGPAVAEALAHGARLDARL